MGAQACCCRRCSARANEGDLKRVRCSMPLLCTNLKPTSYPDFERLHPDMVPCIAHPYLIFAATADVWYSVYVFIQQRLITVAYPRQGNYLIRCACELHYVDVDNWEVTKPWSIWQTVICCEYQVEKKISTCVMVSPSKNTEERCSDQYIKACHRPIASFSPFGILLHVLDIVLANWPP